MPESVYDPDDINLLSSAVADALEIVRQSMVDPLTETQIADFSKQITNNLLEVFNLGERNPSVLRQAALRGISIPPERLPGSMKRD